MKVEGIPREFYLVMGVATTFFLGSAVIAPIFPLYVVAVGASKLELGLIMSTFLFATVALRVPMGMIAERVGRWSLILVALLLQPLSLALYFMASNPMWFYPLRILQALATASFGSIAMAIASDLAPVERRGDIVGRYLTSVGLATVLGPLLCGFFLEYLTYAQMFLLAAVFPLSGLAVLLLGHSQTRGASYFGGTNSLDEENKSGDAWSALKVVVSSRNVLILSVIRFIFSFSKQFFETLFAIYAVNQLLFTPSLVAILLTFRGAANALTRIPSGKLSDRFGRKKPILLAHTLLILTYLTISGTQSFHLLALAMVAFGIAWAMRAVNEWALLGDSVPPGVGAVATGYLQSTFSLGGAVGAMIAGAAAQFLSTPTIFKIAALMILPAMVAIGAAKPNQRLTKP